MLLLSEKLIETCQKATIYLDTNIFIYAQRFEELPTLLSKISTEANAALVTLSSVEYEYSRGSQSTEELQTRRAFVRSLTDTVLQVGKLLESDKNDAFSAAMSSAVSKKDSDYTDYLLAVALHAYKSDITPQFVLSADAKAFPMSLFSMYGVVSLVPSKGEAIHLHLIGLDNKKYGAILDRYR